MRIRTLTAAIVTTAALLGSCSRPSPRPRDVIPGHAWRSVAAAGGPTHTFRAGEQVELLRGGVRRSGTYQFPTDSTLVEDVTGFIPSVGAGGPAHFALRYDVRVLAPGADGRPRLEFRAGVAADTLARTD